MAVIEREVQDRYGLTAEGLQQRACAGQDGAEAVGTLAAADALDRLAASEQNRTDSVDDGPEAVVARATGLAG